jgi:hypothetical protein
LILKSHGVFANHRESWLHERGIVVEEKRKWEAGGWSLYFRDPDRHLLELATPGTWSIY